MTYDGCWYIEFPFRRPQGLEMIEEKSYPTSETPLSIRTSIGYSEKRWLHA